ncbi:MAG: hypothetical protein PHD03_00565 [Bacilli bacterium]|nr:hypothetical protein [Bacilli bacterium]MDD4406741.1 hypothetical protein [Bacilli bacterium]
MAGKITEKTLRGKEAFELYIKNNGDQSIYAYLTNKYGLAVSTIRGNIYHYKNRVISPKPTKEEIELYEEIVRMKHTQIAKRVVSSYQEKISDNFDKDLINDILNIKYTKELITYAIKSQYMISEMFKNIDSAIKYYGYNEEEVSKLNKIKEVIELNRKLINDDRRINAREKVTSINNEKNVNIIGNILEEVLIKGIENLEKIILDSGIRRSTFDKCLPLLANGTELEQTLYNQYNTLLANENKLLEQNYLQMIYYLTNGIIKNGINTYFNLLDYFRMTRLNPIEFQRQGHKLIKSNIITRREFKLVYSFFKLYETSIRILSHEEALDYYYSISGVTVTREQKEMIINYLENELGIKLYTSVFQSACDELLKGTLIIKSLAHV